VLDRRLVGDQYTSFIGADNKLIGKAAGEWLVKRLGSKEAIDMALQILGGNKVPKEVTLPSRVYTKDNLDQGGEELKF